MQQLGMLSLSRSELPQAAGLLHLTRMKILSAPVEMRSRTLPWRAASMTLWRCPSLWLTSLSTFFSLRRSLRLDSSAHLPGGTSGHAEGGQREFSNFKERSVTLKRDRSSWLLWCAERSVPLIECVQVEAPTHLAMAPMSSGMAAPLGVLQRLIMVSMRI